MPDLNYANPAVTQEMEEVIRFWLEDVGVDGFRIDAAKHLIEEGTIYSHSSATHTWLEDFHQHYKELNPEALTIGEIWDNSVAVSDYVRGDELDLAFNFDLAEALLSSARLGNSDQVTRILLRDLELFPSAQFAAFLTNHDQPRTMTMLGNDVDKAKMAASMLLTLPGVPFIYYGEEIGLLGKKPDEFIRTPMQWSDSASSGFTSGIPWLQPNDDYPEKNVNRQSSQAGSLLSHYRNLIHARNQHAALRVGEYVPVTTGNDAILAYLRVSAAEVVLTVINLSDRPVSDYALGVAEGQLSGRYQLVPLMVGGELTGLGALPAPTVHTTGGFEGYQPLPVFPAHSVLVAQLQEQEN